MLHMSQVLDHHLSSTNTDLKSCWSTSSGDTISMSNDLRALHSPSTSSSSTASGCSSGTSPKQSTWQRNASDGLMQCANGFFREPDRMENGEKIKRPMNAFMVWSQIRRAQIANQDGKMHNSQISKELGIEWRKMNAEQKAPYIQRAKDLRDELMRQHPDYVYRPKRKPRLRQKSSSSVRPLNASSSSSAASSLNIPQTLTSTPNKLIQIPSTVSINSHLQTIPQLQSQPSSNPDPNSTTQFLLSAATAAAAAAQQQQSILLAAYQAQQLLASSNKFNDIHNDKIFDKISEATQKYTATENSSTPLLTPSVNLSAMLNPTSVSSLDDTRNFTDAVAYLNAHFNPLFLQQLSNSFMLTNSSSHSRSQ
ncbi:unnamed protein product [Anisakis simplex]|uniref:Sex-determining region Y protein n=1 Tax=Anisakis simplex TaxID=6269 RepID=A0A0M3K6W5_ANISI|nr:unnamed protein product [Anisakis simplex]